ncbi:MAG TPA: NTP transferase domain-containing protein [Candidatus Binataceae bacterium]|nr:NTP transferase domain-containing protein [Candidatus Binataceae bacterium]
MDQRLSGAIIAAGKGERLRSAVEGLPKPLVRIGGETLIERQARLLAAAGADPVNAIVNSETAQLIQAAKLRLPPRLAIMVRDTPNSMESFLALGDRIPLGRFLMTTVDTVVALGELQRFVGTALSRMNLSSAAPDGVLGVVGWRGDRHPLFAEMAADGTLVRLGGEKGRLVTAGVYLFSTSIFEFAAEARSLGLDALRRYLEFVLVKGMKLAAIELTEVVDVDEGDDLRTAQALACRD